MTLFMRTRRNQRSLINDIIEYLNDNYTDIHCKKGMFEKFGISDSYLCRFFKEDTNTSISEYINIKRVEFAKELLTDKDIRVIDVAYHAGFNNLTYFHRIFKKYTGSTPLEWERGNSSKKAVG
jgi:AraC-like DNA-binding protein